LLRHAMRGKLPEDVRLRRKAPLAGDPIDQHWQRGEIELHPELLESAICQRYIDPVAWSQSCNAQATPHHTQQVTRAMSLGYWLNCTTVK
jgi:hypothetical protein